MDIEKARFNMVKQQIQTWDVSNPDILDIVMTTPRETFVPAHLKDLAFADTRLDIGHDQKMMTPKEEAKILQSLIIKNSDIVLEIGTGAGYLTALLAKQAKHVYSVDIVPEFVTGAQQKLEQQNIHNVTLEVADAASGWEHHAPYDVIVVTGSLESLPESFKKSLKPDGRIFCILGQKPAMAATLLHKDSHNKWQEQVLYETEIGQLINAPRAESFTF